MRILKVAGFTIAATLSLFVSAGGAVVISALLDRLKILPSTSMGLVGLICLMWVIHSLIMLKMSRPFALLLGLRWSRLMLVGTLCVPTLIIATAVLRYYLRELFFQYGNPWMIDQYGASFMSMTLPLMWLMPLMFVWLWNMMLRPQRLSA